MRLIYLKRLRRSKLVKSQKIRLYYGLFLTALTVLVGVSFIVAVSRVYYIGLSENPDYPFEISRIREHILLPFIFLLCYIAAIIGGGVLSVVFPVAQRKASYKQNGKTLERLKSRIPVDGGEQFAAAKADLSKYERTRMIVWGVALAVFLEAAIAIFVYSFNIANYHADALKADILNLVKNVLSWTVAGLAVGIIAVVVDEVLIKREINAAKTAIVAGERGALPPVSQTTKNAVIAASVSAGAIVGVAIISYALAPLLVQSTLKASQTVIYVLVFLFAAVIAACFAVYQTVKCRIPDRVNSIILLSARIALGVIAITFILVGIFNGGANDVLIKAINICTECIGLG